MNLQAPAVGPLPADAQIASPSPNSLSETPTPATIHLVAPRPQSGKPVAGKGASHMNGRPMRRRMVSKTVVISPEARRAAEDRHRNEVENFIALGKMEKCPPRYALGSVNLTLFGTEV